MSSIGLMLFTVREACAADFEGTLHKVAAIGYEGVELFDLHGHSIDRIGSWVRDVDLVICARHISLEDAEQNMSMLAEEAEALDCRRLVISWLDPEDLTEATLARLAAAGAAARTHSLELGFHNHADEIATGFVQRLPDEVFLELDAGWAWWAGADPVDLLDRAPVVHVKDFRSRDTWSFCPVGEGAVGYDRFVPAAERAGVEWLLIEQDQADSELDAARRSFDAVSRYRGLAA